MQGQGSGSGEVAVTRGANVTVFSGEVGIGQGLTHSYWIGPDERPIGGNSSQIRFGVFKHFIGHPGDVTAQPLILQVVDRRPEWPVTARSPGVRYTLPGGWQFTVSVVQQDSSRQERVIYEPVRYSVIDGRVESFEPVADINSKEPLILRVATTADVNAVPGSWDPDNGGDTAISTAVGNLLIRYTLQMTSAGAAK